MTDPEHDSLWDQFNDWAKKHGIDDPPTPGRSRWYEWWLANRETLSKPGAPQEKARSLLPAMPIEPILPTSSLPSSTRQWVPVFDPAVRPEHKEMFIDTDSIRSIGLEKVEWERSVRHRATYYYFEVTGVVMFKKKVRVKVRMRLWDDEVRSLGIPGDAWTVIGRMSRDEQIEVLLKVLAAKVMQQSDDVAMKWIVRDM